MISVQSASIWYKMLYYGISKGTAFLDKSVSFCMYDYLGIQRKYLETQFYNQPIRTKNHKRIIAYERSILFRLPSTHQAHLQSNHQN